MRHREHRTLLSEGLLVTMDGNRTVGVGDVLIESDRIVAVGPNAAGRKRIDEKIDCRGQVIIPGLVQPHVHLCQTLFRNRANGLQLLEWLRQRIWPLEAAHTKETLKTAAEIGAAELLCSGTTAILDMGTVHHTDAIFEACSQVGLRATIGKAMMDRHDQGVPEGLRETTESSMEESLRLIHRWHGADNDRLRYAFAPRFVLSCTEQLLERIAHEARNLSVGVHTHASENEGELEVVRDMCGDDNVAYLDALGLTGKRSVFAHCVHVDERERDILARTKTSVAHCPSSNLKLGSGVAPIPDLLARGINVGIAADGAPCNDNLDGFLEMRLASLIQSPVHGPDALPARKVMEMATLGGARALDLEARIGSLEVGKQADVVVVNLDRYHAVPEGDIYETLVHALRGSDVDKVFVDGVMRVKNGRVLALNGKRVRAKARKAAAQLERDAFSLA